MVSSAGRPVREFKLFGDLLLHLAKGPRPFAIVDSGGQVELESTSWKVVSEDVQKRAVSEAAEWIALLGATEKGWSGNLGRWMLPVHRIKLEDGNCWYVGAASSDDRKDQQEIASAERAPIFWSDKLLPES